MYGAQCQPIPARENGTYGTDRSHGWRRPYRVRGSNGGKRPSRDWPEWPSWTRRTSRPARDAIGSSRAHGSCRSNGRNRTHRCNRRDWAHWIARINGAAGSRRSRRPDRPAWPSRPSWPDINRCGTDWTDRSCWSNRSNLDRRRPYGPNGSYWTARSHGSAGDSCVVERDIWRDGHWVGHLHGCRRSRKSHHGQWLCVCEWNVWLR